MINKILRVIHSIFLLVDADDSGVLKVFLIRYAGFGK